MNIVVLMTNFVSVTAYNVSKLNRREHRAMLNTKEHYELLEQFERDFKGKRLDKENKVFWASGNIYQSGEVNQLFLAYRLGYSFAKSEAK